MLRKLMFSLVAMAVMLTNHAGWADHSASWGPTGVQRYNPAKAFDGLTLLFTGRGVWFINNEGNVVHKFKLDRAVDTRSNFTTQGWFMSKTGTESWDAYDMDGNLVRRFYPPEGWELHHSFNQMPNGNLMGIGLITYTYEEAVAAGRLPELMDRDVFKPDGVIVWDPEGNIVWTVDPMRDGLLAPEKTYNKIDINLVSNSSNDFMHMNGIAYDPVRNWVYTSNRDIDEILAFDYATKELVWRWGNPANWDASKEYPYSTVDLTHAGIDDDRISMGDQTLAEQHCTQFNPLTGNVAIFNNGKFPGGIGSLLQEIDPDTDEVVFQWPNSPTNLIFRNRIGSIQVLPNGNYLGNFGGGRGLIEVTPDGEIAWEYLLQWAGSETICFIDTFGSNSSMGDAWKFGYDFQGFEGVTFNVNPPQPFVPGGCDAAHAVVPVWQQAEPVKEAPTISITGGTWVNGQAVDISLTVTGPGPYDIMAGFEDAGQRFYLYEKNLCRTDAAGVSRSGSVNSNIAAIAEDLIPDSGGTTIQLFDFTIPLDWDYAEYLTVQVIAGVYNPGMTTPLASDEATVNLNTY